ncbi:MAG: hypothetical protein NVS3B18_14630 [Candidatus Dormibacteria bacterium]
MNSKCLGALCAATALAASLAATPAVAAPTLGPVTFRAEGPTSTLVSTRPVSTVAGSFTKDGNAAHSCPNASAGGVLERGTSGNWTGTYSASLSDYFVETIGGVAPGNNQYWSIWYNHAPSQSGACGQVVNAGDDVLLFINCYPGPGTTCPNSGNGYAVLGEGAPATALSGSPVTVTVTTYDPASGVPGPAAGATVSAGSLTAIADAKGQATLTFPAAGSYAVQATAPDSIRSEVRSVCVHSGNDGTCGTTAPPATTPAATPAPAQAVTPMPPAPPVLFSALSPHLFGVINHHHYSAAGAPRKLSGSVPTTGPITAVELKLTRVTGNRCSYYSGRSERFVRSRCDGGAFFKVSSSSSFDYLLPSKLSHGHYVEQARPVEVGGKQDISAPVSFNVR